MAAMLRRILAGLRSGDWLDRRRVVGYASVLLIVEVVGFLFLVAGTHGLIVPLDRPTTTDFVSFYAAGALADAGTPQLAYDQAAHDAAEERATEPGIGYQFFYYPPVYLLLCAVLARLPYLSAYVIFAASTLAGFLLVARAILRDGGTAAIPLLAFPAVFWTIGLGQNAFLTAALFGAGTLLIDRRPVAAGLLFGALCYKPHFGLLIPVALAAGGRWRAFAAAASSVGVLVTLSLLVFGASIWQDFAAAMAGAHATYESGRLDLGGFVSPFAAVLLAGGPRPLAYAVQLCATFAAAALVTIVWRRGLSLPIRGAALAAATLVAIPVVLIYDLILAAIAALWLVRAGRAGGFLPWEKTALAGLFAIPLVARGFGDASHIPLGPLAAIVLVFVVGARVAHELAPQRRDDARWWRLWNKSYVR